MPFISYPSACEVKAIFYFCNEIEQHCEANEVIIDFSSMGRIEPFTMVCVAKYIRNFNCRSKGTVVSCRGHQSKDCAQIWFSSEPLGLSTVEA